MTAVLTLAAALFAVPASASDKSELLHDANRTVDNLKHDPAFESRQPTFAVTSEQP